MSRDSGGDGTSGERSQRTVAELLAQYGENGGGGRRHRRRATDPSETAPQQIIERVLSDSGMLPRIDENTPDPATTGRRARKRAMEAAKPVERSTERFSPPGATAVTRGAGADAGDVPRTGATPHTATAADIPQKTPAATVITPQPTPVTRPAPTRTHPAGGATPAPGVRTSVGEANGHTPPPSPSAQSAAALPQPIYPTERRLKPSTFRPPLPAAPVPSASGREDGDNWFDGGEPGHSGRARSEDFEPPARPVAEEVTQEQRFPRFPTYPASGATAVRAPGYPAGATIHSQATLPPTAAAGQQAASVPPAPIVAGPPRSGATVVGSTPPMPQQAPPGQPARPDFAIAEQATETHVDGFGTALDDPDGGHEDEVIARAWGRPRPGEAPAGLDGVDLEATGAYTPDQFDEDDDDISHLGDEDADHEDAQAHAEPGRERTPSQEWLAMGYQLGAGVIGGAAMWLGFQWLWSFSPGLALGLALVAIVGLVLIVRAVRKADDVQTMVLTVLVGLLVTVSPAALLLVAR